MIRPIVKMGHQCLREPAKEVVEFDTPELHDLIEDLRDTMKANEGVGIAAPQIGVSLKVIIFGFETSKRYPHAKPVPETILINPTYTTTPAAQTYEDWEGCLSICGIRGLVTRYNEITVHGFSPKGEAIKQQVTGFYAKVIQHETDHLNGILFVERITNLKFFGFEDEIQALMQTTGKKLA